MSYYSSKIFETRNFQAVLDEIPHALSQEGFGVLTEIDVAAVMKKKLDRDIHPYRILGACNPHFAYDALQAENKIGTMLPCNVVIQELDNGNVEVSVVDPVASMSAIKNPSLAALAQEVRVRLLKVLEHLA